MSEKLFGMVSLSRKAGKLTNGFDAVKEAVQDGSAKLVIYSCDISARTKTAMDRVVQAGENPTRQLSTKLTMHDYGCICGKPTGVLALTDAGFATAVANLIEED